MGQSTGRFSHQVLLDQMQPEEKRTYTSTDCRSSLVHGTIKFFKTILFFRSYRIYIYIKKEVPPEETPKKAGPEEEAQLSP